MNCPACLSPNPDASRFCNRCGTVLATATANAVPPMPPAAASGPHAPPAYSPPAYSPPPRTAASPLTAPAFASAGPGIAYAAAGSMAMPTGAAASGLLARILNITLKPGAEWPVVAAEPPSMGRVVVGCVLPLAAIQALLSFVHMAVIGVSVPFAGTMRMPLAASLTAALMGFVFALIGVFVAAIIVNAWAPFFTGRRSMGEALKVAAYAGVPAWLGSFFVILPAFGTLLGLLAVLYTIYVLYLGLPVVMRAPKERALGYTVAVILTGIVMGLVLGALSMAFGGFTRFGMPGRSPELQAQQGAAITGNIIGNMLGTDDRGKAALGQALGSLARAGQQMEQAQRAQVPATPALSPAEAAARAQQEAAQTGNVIGGLLGTDPQGRAALGQALGNLVRAGQEAQASAGTQNASGNAPAAAAVSADAAANTGAAVGGLLNALGGALGGSHRVTPVDFRTLAGVLPEAVNGMPRGAPRGENREAMGVKASSAGATYGGGNGSIVVKISDISGVSGLLDIAGNLEHTSDAQTATGFERDTTIGGRSVHEKFSNAGRRSELQVIVAKRFEVDLEGSGVEMAALEQALGQIDLARLESMRNVGAQN